MGSLQFPNMGMGLRLAAFGRRSSAMSMGLCLVALSGRRSSAIKIYKESEMNDLDSIISTRDCRAERRTTKK